MNPVYRPYPLTAVKAGITRMRVKGSANPNTLYDLLNAKVTESGSIRIREGSMIDVKLPANTKGLMAWHGKLILFSHTTVAPPSSKYVVYVLTNPLNPGNPIAKIHFSTPYVGAPYVVAEFNDGTIRHFWLEDATAWKAATVYKNGSLVAPTVANGFAYEASRLGDAFPAWAPNVPRAIGDKIEPVVYNGFYYQVTAVSGTTPRSGLTEPVWPIHEGEQVYEETDNNPTATSSSGGSTTPPTADPPTDDGVGDDPYCLEENSWLSAHFQVSDLFYGMEAYLHTPERGFFHGPCVRVEDSRLERCVRIVTQTASVVCSRTTPVNHAEAVADLAEDGHWSWAYELLGKNVRVEEDVEEVLQVEEVGYRWIRRANFRDASVAASEMKGGRRIFTHNARIVK